MCLRKLQSNIQFDLLERYARLQEFFHKEEDKRVGQTLQFYNTVVERVGGSFKK